MADLILGPMLRHVSETSATIWVETDAPCEVEVLGRTARTFCVESHHYALVVVEDLAPGSTTPYEVLLDGRVRWPDPTSAFPPSRIRTIDCSSPLRVVFGSCRAAAPHEPPWSLELAFDARGRGVDALRAHALRMTTMPPETWPNLAVMLGDQVYADDSSPRAREMIAARRTGSPDEPPGDHVADFEEYCWLYHESWAAEAERWFFSVVPTAMIFDDHDMIDDWNISSSWVRDIRAEPWWEERVIGGLVSYWLYQHLGNLSPAEIEREGMLAALGELSDGGPYLRQWARASEEFTPTPGGYRFSYSRDLGCARLVVVDSRNGRVLERGRRAMLDGDELAWVTDACSVDTDHLIIATSLPVFVPGALHDLQTWSEAVCDGAWGRWAARLGERLRRALDLEDWPAFSASFDDLTALIGRIGAGRAGSGSPPATITVVSGDIHFSYLARIDMPPQWSVRSAVHQAVSSPMRNALVPRERRVIRAALSRAGRVLGRNLRRATRRARSAASWELVAGPVFANVLGELRFDGRRAHVVLEQARADERGEPVLSIAIDVPLTST